MTEPQDRTILCEISIDSDGDLTGINFASDTKFPMLQLARVFAQLAEAFITASDDSDDSRH